LHEYTSIYDTTEKSDKKKNFREIRYARKLEPLKRFRKETTEHLQQLSVEIPFDLKGMDTLTEGGDHPITGHTRLGPNGSFPSGDNKSSVSGRYRPSWKTLSHRAYKSRKSPVPIPFPFRIFSRLNETDYPSAGRPARAIKKVESQIQGRHFLKS